MSTAPGKKVAADDRSMAVANANSSPVFFFPKHNPPVSIRAASREEAEKLLAEQDAALEAPNAKEV
jgi:hypothetical protein